MYLVGPGYLFRRSEEVLVANSRVRHGAQLDTTVSLVDSLSPRLRSGERVRERGFQLAAPIRLKVPPALSPLVPRGERERWLPRWSWYSDAPRAKPAVVLG